MLAATAQGAIVPSSGPYGTLRAEYPKKFRRTPSIQRTSSPGPPRAVIPQKYSPYPLK